jgi:hypothetical protein
LTGVGQQPIARLPSNGNQIRGLNKLLPPILHPKNQVTQIPKRLIPKRMVSRYACDCPEILYFKNSPPIMDANPTKLTAPSTM